MGGGLFTAITWIGVMFFLHQGETTTFSRTNDPGLTEIPFLEIPTLSTFIEIDNCAIEDFFYFPGLVSLTKLSLKGNRLTVLPDLANISTSLQRLYLGLNNISYIDQARISVLSSLIELSLDGNAHLAYFPDCILPGTYSLRTLHLLDVSLVEFPDLPCFGQSLQYLVMSRFTFTSIQDSRLGRLTQLRMLSIPNGPLTELPRGSLLNNTLESFIVHNSDISEVPIEHVPCGGTLTMLSLKGNAGLGTLPNLRRVMPSGSTLKIGGLSLVCDCRLLWLLDAVAIGTTDIQMSDTSCSSPAALDGVMISELVQSDLQCEGNIFVLTYCIM